MYAKFLAGSHWRAPRTPPFWERPDRCPPRSGTPEREQEEALPSDRSVPRGRGMQTAAGQNENMSEPASGRVQQGAGMTSKTRSADAEIHQALIDLRSRTESSLRLFNNAVPHATWLRRSEIDRLTADMVWAVEKAPLRRRPTPWGQIKNALSWVGRLKASARVR